MTPRIDDHPASRPEQGPRTPREAPTPAGGSGTTLRPRTSSTGNHTALRLIGLALLGHMLRSRRFYERVTLAALVLAAITGLGQDNWAGSLERLIAWNKRQVQHFEAKTERQAQHFEAKAERQAKRLNASLASAVPTSGNGRHSAHCGTTQPLHARLGCYGPPLTRDPCGPSGQGKRLGQPAPAGGGHDKTSLPWPRSPQPKSPRRTRHISPAAVAAQQQVHAGPVPADYLRSRPGSEPCCERVRGPFVQDVDGPAVLDVDQQCPVAVSLAQRELVNPEHPRRRAERGIGVASPVAIFDSEIGVFSVKSH